MCPKELILAAAAMSMCCPPSCPSIAEMECEIGATDYGQAIDKNNTPDSSMTTGRSSVRACCYLKDSLSKESRFLNPHQFQRA